ncbi:ABC transporter G family member 31 [Glycine soja]|uniref:ABC transporter G family member 31 n=1 Tax=Glycine soja TaxID=3848 RepID=A0A445I4B0_GLYSO|nr:ABC transporter G family member 31 [Glycine soja]
MEMQRKTKEKSLQYLNSTPLFKISEATCLTKIDYVLKVLGLDVCSDTVVGNDMLRGVSGGQKRSVTTGEMIVGARKALFMDEILTGLDSSTTFQIVKCIRNFVHQMDAAVLMALLQPAPETFNLFDDLLLLSEG